MDVMRDTSSVSIIEAGSSLSLTGARGTSRLGSGRGFRLAGSRVCPTDPVGRVKAPQKLWPLRRRGRGGDLLRELKEADLAHRHQKIRVLEHLFWVDGALPLPAQPADILLLTARQVDGNEQPVGRLGGGRVLGGDPLALARARLARREDGRPTKALLAEDVAADGGSAATASEGVLLGGRVVGTPSVLIELDRGPA
ncbi:hypothetical protein PoMZ_00843 [Pyricularia oryzae]|uniref:Uncharacterized protein n=1 Tax=Pyricularia oryzae TaxID=318829 RepID=A0A4P7N0T5_PYROR|nr:hypothetical protein PoMZ_00843 [Pyricularia oryzae]